MIINNKLTYSLIYIMTETNQSNGTNIDRANTIPDDDVPSKEDLDNRDNRTTWQIIKEMIALQLIGILSKRG